MATQRSLDHACRDRMQYLEPMVPKNSGNDRFDPVLQLLVAGHDLQVNH